MKSWPMARIKLGEPVASLSIVMRQYFEIPEDISEEITEDFSSTDDSCLIML